MEQNDATLFQQGIEDLRLLVREALAADHGDDIMASSAFIERLAGHLRRDRSEGELSGAIYLLSALAQAVARANLGLATKLAELVVEASDRLVRIIHVEDGEPLPPARFPGQSTARVLPRHVDRPVPADARSMLEVRCTGRNRHDGRGQGGLKATNE